MGSFYRNYIENNLFFWVFSMAGLILIFLGFVCPPLGEIDNSVLVGVGELNGTIALGCVLRAIDKGTSATFQHNNTSISINKEQEEEGED